MGRITLLLNTKILDGRSAHRSSFVFKCNENVSKPKY